MSSLTECNWEQMNQQLLHERKYPVAMMIPDHLVTCQQSDIYQVSDRETLLKYFFWVSWLCLGVYWKFTIGGICCIVESDEVP